MIILYSFWRVITRQRQNMEPNKDKICWQRRTCYNLI